MATPEKAPDPDEDQVQVDSLNCEIIELADGDWDTTVRPMRESLRKLLKPPYNGQPYPPEVQAEIDQLKGSAPKPPEPPPDNPPS